MKQMHYTVTEAIRPLVNKLNRFEEALIAVDKKVQETQKHSDSIPLVIPTGSPRTEMPQSIGVKETEYGLAEMAARNNNSPTFELDNKRSEIRKMDSYLADHPYQ